MLNFCNIFIKLQLYENEKWIHKNKIFFLLLRKRSDYIFYNRYIWCKLNANEKRIERIKNEYHVSLIKNSRQSSPFRISSKLFNIKLQKVKSMHLEILQIVKFHEPSNPKTAHSLSGASRLTNSFIFLPFISNLSSTMAHHFNVPFINLAAIV